jgi:hypothetical protein
MEAHGGTWRHMEERRDEGMKAYGSGAFGMAHLEGERGAGERRLVC